MKQIQIQLIISVRLTKIKQLLICLFVLLIFASSSFAQVSTLKLSTNDLSSYFDITDVNDNSILRMRADGRLGINQSVPKAGLHVVSNHGFLVEGTFNNGTSVSIGAGSRMHWYSRKGAFRAGGVDGTQWDDSNDGFYSFASGYSTTASGDYSTAFGNGSTASGYSSTAGGYSSTGSGYSSSAIGYICTASGDYSTAMGRSTNSSAESATALGVSTTASGIYSTALGRSTTASGLSSTSMGESTTASGAYSTAMGKNVSTNSNMGSFIIGDASGAILNSSATNQMTMRFAGGYKLYTNSGFTVGIELAASGNSWSSISDSTKKENFKFADGETFLNSIAALRLGSWNYKGQNPKNFRHYGPMAQEIFSYFGNDGIGTIGCDTLLATADMDGIMMIAIQGLVKRTNILQTSINELRTTDLIFLKQSEIIKMRNLEIKIQKEKIKELEVEMVSQKELMNSLIIELNNVKNTVLEIKKKSNEARKIVSLTENQNIGEQNGK